MMKTNEPMKEAGVVGWARELADNNPDVEPGWMVEAAIRWMEGQEGPYYYPHHAGNDLEIIEHAKRLQDATGDSSGSLSVSPPSHGDAIFSDQLVEAVEPWMIQKREELTERVTGLTLPFPGLQAMADWIESVGEEEGPTQKEREEAKTLLQQIEEKRQDVEALTGYTLSPVQAGVVALPYVKPGSSQILTQGVYRGSPLFPLADDLETVSDATGFHPVRLVLYVLLDEKPFLNSVSVETDLMKVGRVPDTDGASVHRREVTITLRSPEVTLKQLREIFRHVREGWEAKERNRLTDEDRALWEVVQGVAQDEDVDLEGRFPWGFWGEVKDRLEDRGYSKKSELWRKQWSRGLQDRVNLYGEVRTQAGNN